MSELVARLEALLINKEKIVQQGLVRDTSEVHPYMVGYMTSGIEMILEDLESGKIEGVS